MSDEALETAPTDNDDNGEERARNLAAERDKIERILRWQSDAIREYSVGKLRTA